ncbi:hypothetical protein G7046_g4630 [Stylonectria norvegica]|nr:hypothetical protein G7046_g4630 [Stylonectria norvegica]
MSCAHRGICIDGTSTSASFGFVRPPLEKRLAATTAAGRLTSKSQFVIPKDIMSDGWTFPGPLVLPDDDLALDPKYPPQSLRSWLSYSKELPITPERKTIYVVPPPEVSKNVGSLMKGWETPVVPRDAINHRLPGQIPLPTTDDLCDYLGAFYHGMEIKSFDAKFRWQLWDASPAKDTGTYIGLATPAPVEELVGVRYRSSLDGIARKQLNLNDLLDTLIDRVPPNAYAIVMLVHQDLYEDDDDDFCCGRAYGASRIAVVSSFRYHPSLDTYSGVDHPHMWPASHCKAYTGTLCVGSKPHAKRTKVLELENTLSSNSPLVAAIGASGDSLEPKTREDYSGLWFSRVARTISHELGHCLGLDHCVYYACAMQGTAGMAEDVRQPPYLCPVCLTKLSLALYPLLGSGDRTQLQQQYVKLRYEALLLFCSRWRHVGMFGGFQAWVDKRLEQTAKEALG